MMVMTLIVVVRVGYDGGDDGDGSNMIMTEMMVTIMVLILWR
jgi:hypothetical protein